MAVASVAWNGEGWSGDHSGCLPFGAGARIEVLQEGEPDGWWLGRLGGRQGWYPSAYCALEPPAVKARDPRENDSYRGDEDKPQATGSSDRAPEALRSDPLDSGHHRPRASSVRWRKSKPQNASSEVTQPPTATLLVGRPDLIAEVKQPAFVWRSLPLLAELAPFLRTLLRPELEPLEAFGTAQQASLLSPVSEMFSQVAEHLRSAAQAQQLCHIADAFEEAAKWESTLHMAWKMYNLLSQKVSIVTDVTRKIRRALDRLMTTPPTSGHMVIIPAGWVGYQGSEVPANLVMLVVTRDMEVESALSVMLCNAGQGAFQYHYSEYELPPAVRLRPCIQLPRIEAAALQDHAMLCMLTQLRVHHVFYTPQSPSIYFYEAVVTELLNGSTSLRDAFDNNQPLWCENQWIKGHFNTGQADKQTINECLLALFQRFEFEKHVVEKLFQNLRLGTLQQLEDDIHLALHGPSPGLKWTYVGSSLPATGTEIVNEKLSSALQQHKFEFTQDEFDAFGVENLRPTCFIKIGGFGWQTSYFQPMPTGECEVIQLHARVLHARVHHAKKSRFRHDNLAPIPSHHAIVKQVSAHQSSTLT